MSTFTSGLMTDFYVANPELYAAAHPKKIASMLVGLAIVVIIIAVCLLSLTSSSILQAFGQILIVPSVVVLLGAGGFLAHSALKQ